MLFLLLPFAYASVVAAVPPDATAVTVLVCRADDGCPAQSRALAAHLAEVGAPLLDFDAVAAAGPGGQDARTAFTSAMARLERLSSSDAAADALEALRAAPLTVPVETLLDLHLRVGDGLLAAGDRAGAEKALAAAASASNGQVWNLPPIADATLSRYLDLATVALAPATLQVRSEDPEARVFVDGRPSGPAPAEVSVRPGWHRVTVERPGRYGAWVAEIAAPEGRTLTLTASVPDNSGAALEAAVEGAIRGTPAPLTVSAPLADWGASQGLRWIRFVTLSRTRAAGDPVPEEVIPDVAGEGEGTWNVAAVWLDVGLARFVGHGPGPASLREASGRGRFRFGVDVGYTRLQPLDDRLNPHDHVGVELAALVRLNAWLAVDARLGLLRSAQLYYLREGVVEHDVYSVAGGVRFGAFTGRSGGPYAGVAAIAVVPMALGGQVVAGWEIAPSSRWRLGLEAQGGLIDDGVLFGGRVTVGFSD